MTREEIEVICTQRLEAWKKRLVANHSTPLILLGFGHDHRSGDVQLIIPENAVNKRELVGFLRFVLRKVQSGKVEI